MKVSSRVEEVNPRERLVGEIAELIGERIRRQEARHQNDTVEHHQDRQRRIRGHFRGHGRSIRIRGSSRYSRRSATRLAPTRNVAENMTTASTRAKSRATMASRKSGPRPGQPITTSTSSEALRSVPSEKPNKETSGFMAAGSRCRKSSRRRG